MAYLMEFDDWREGYVQIVRHVASRGAFAPSRGGDTLEVRDFVFTVAPDTYDLPLGTGRRINPSLAAAEAIQLCAGHGMPALTEAAAKQVTSYVRDPDGTVHGNYGDRVDIQIEHVVQKLNADPSSRQAVIQIWDKYRDGRWRDPMPKDIPCTIAITFSLGASGLVASTVMRSNDVWLGMPFDVFQFRQLQRTIAYLLEVPIGEYCHHAVSMHLYQKDVQKVAELVVDQLWRPNGDLPTGLHADSAANLHGLMSRVLVGQAQSIQDPSHAWYHAALGDAYATAMG